MKGVGFWFTPSVPGKEKTAPQLNSSSFSKYYPLFTCHRCSARVVLPLLDWVPTQHLIYFHHISHYQLLGWACPKSHLSSLLSLVEMLPSFGNCLILSSIASLKAPQPWSLSLRRGPSSSWRTSRPLPSGSLWLTHGGRESLPVPRHLCTASSQHYSAKNPPRQQHADAVSLEPPLELLEL